MKILFLALLFSLAAGCNSGDVDNKNMKTSDSGSRKSLDSSKIINSNSKLPSDTSGTTVNH